MVLIINQEYFRVGEQTLLARVKQNACPLTFTLVVMLLIVSFFIYFFFFFVFYTFLYQLNRV
jgi:hypothetical protein